MDLSPLHAEIKAAGDQPGRPAIRQRAASAKCVNAQARNRGLRQFLLRGSEKVRAVLPGYALAHNLMRAARPVVAPAAP